MKQSIYKKAENKYECECGRIFSKANGLNGHFNYCIKHNEALNKKPSITDIKFRASRGWNKGLTCETDDRIKERTINLIEKYKSGKLTPSFKDKHHTKETKEKLSKIAKDKNYGGHIPGSGRGQKTWYESPIAGKIYLDSSYELAYAQYLDFNNIKWERNLKKFYYEWNENQHYYVPDFYLIDLDEYVEIKGFDTAKDKIKWKSFPHKLRVLFGNDLLSLGLNVKTDNKCRSWKQTEE